MKRIQYYFLFLLMLLSLFASAQKISNIHFEQVGKQIHIYYDLDGDDSYDVQVFCSTDNGQSWGNPLKYVTGAVNENQIPGKGKMMVWDVLTEREKLEGEIRFKIEIINAGKYTDKRDGQTYNWLRIGKQVWMAENLNYKTYSGSWCYDNNPSICDVYGRLYDWDNARVACPKGWHLPSSDEWMELLAYSGELGIASGELKEPGFKHWVRPNTGATNVSNFSALPGGFLGYYGSDLGLGYYRLGYEGNWWSDTEKSSTRAWMYFLYHDKENKFNGTNLFKNEGLSVRCVKD